MVGSTGLLVLGVGSPMLDSLVTVSEEFLERHQLRKGDATQIEHADAFAKLKFSAEESSGQGLRHGCGGCATNFLKVMSVLGLRAALCGGIGRDGVARIFKGLLEGYGVVDATVDVDEATGEVLCLATPDGERTFAYFAGASSLLSSLGLSRAAQRLSQQYEAALQFVYFDVYNLLCPDRLLEDSLQEAKAGCAKAAKTGLNLGSPSMVTKYRERIMQVLLSDWVDVLTLNAAEADALCQSDRTEPFSSGTVLETVARHCELVVLTMGAEGVCLAGRSISVQRFSVGVVNDVMDSIGAGDFFAGAFIAAWLRDLSLQKCVEWGHYAAESVLQVASSLCSYVQEHGLSSTSSRR